MKALKIIFTVIGLLALTACGGGGSSSTASTTTTTTSSTVTGVATASQVSVVTAK